MRFFSIGIATFLLFSLVVASNWTPEDYEIFSLNDKIKKDLGSDITFYSWLGLENGPKATLKEISKAYRKKSRALHPDKYGSASQRFQRLSLVGNILRDQSLKKRYDYFLDKGFPKWRGTGYLYSKFRPGFLLTIAIVFVLVGGFHFVALRISRNQDFKRISEMKEQMKVQAWGGSQIPPTDGSDRKVINEANGRAFRVKNDGRVYLIDIDSNEDVMEIDEHSINRYPGFKDSLFFKVPAYLWNKSVAR
ncbi:predicted protein, partial [Scheffersomyces stipitis CBS 6054]